MMYINGDGVLKNFEKAKYWIKKAYENGAIEAKVVWERNKLWEY